MLIPIFAAKVGEDVSETVELDKESDPQAVRGYAFYDWGKSALRLHHRRSVARMVCLSFLESKWFDHRNRFNRNDR